MDASFLMKQNALGFAAQAAGFICNLIFNIVFPVLLGSLVFGKLSIVLGFAYLLIGLFEAGFNNALMLFVSRSYAEKKFSDLIGFFNYLLKIKLVFSSVLAVGLFASSFWLSSVYDVPLVSIQVISALIILFGIVTFLISFFTAIGKNRIGLFGTVINAFFLILFPLLAYFCGFKFTGVIIAVILAYLISALFLVFAAFAEVRKLRKKPKKIFFSDVFSAVLDFSLISLSGVFVNWGILLIAGLFVSSVDVAFFKVSLSWVLALVALTPISASVVFSSFVGLKASGSNSFFNYSQKAMKYGFMIVIPLMFGLFFIGPKLIRLVYGLEYVGASVPLIIICWSILPLFINSILLSVLVSFGKLRRASRIYLSSVFVGIVLSFALSFYFGLMGASFAFVVTNYFVFVLFYYTIRKQCGFAINIAYIAKPLLASLIMSMFIFFLLNFARSFVAGILLVLGSVAFYFAVLYFIKGISKKDLSLLKLLK